MASKPINSNTTRALAHRAQSAAASLRKGKAPALKVTGRLRTAIQAMVFDGLNRTQAAEAAGLQDHSVREALKRPHVLAYLNEQMEVLRTGARPQALNRIIHLTTNAESERVQLDAATYLDGMDRHSNSVGAVNVQVNTSVNVETPGYVIKLNRRAESPQQIDHLAQHDANALNVQQDVPSDD